MLDPAPRRIDTGQRQSVRLIGDVNTVCHQLLINSEEIQADREWIVPFMEHAEKLAEVLQRNLLTRLDEQWLGASLGALLPSESSLFLGSSLPIRVVDIFSTKHLPRVYASRGVSGIDGLIATAAGCAAGNQGVMVLLIGDIAFLHDLNSLKLAAQCKTPLVIVLVNNDGGGIFHVTTKGADSAAAQVISDYFVTPMAFQQIMPLSYFVLITLRQKPLMTLLRSLTKHAVRLVALLLKSLPSLVRGKKY